MSATFAAWTIRNEVRKRADEEEKLWWSRAHSIIGSVSARDVVGAHARELEFHAQSYSDLPIFNLRVAVSIDPVGALTCHLLRSDRPVRLEQEAGSVVVLFGHLAPGGASSATVRCESKVDWSVGSELWSYSDAQRTVWHSGGTNQWRRGGPG
ncbi:hypothetical protein [Micromonospora fulviviridis]|uniref:hypothetical protein n=1 Tax=Micromonospora fulviviridis TaxID=47860 RepID=UPI001667C4C4|nr:hypothetical protein [Micromonospora fulviviridis]